MWKREIDLFRPMDSNTTSDYFNDDGDDNINDYNSNNSIGIVLLLLLICVIIGGCFGLRTSNNYERI